MKKLLLFLKKIFFKVGSCFYVGATDVLPEPLSKKDEEYYVKLKEEGDTLAKEKLIEHNLRLVVFLAKKYENTGVSPPPLAVHTAKEGRQETEIQSRLWASA